VDFSGSNGEIELVLARMDKWVRLQIINTGPPLPETLHGRIFDSLTGTRAGEGHHLGLGLYVVRLIVQYHHGQVRAFNHPAGGRVVFEVLLPALD
jgi:two-component system sensor histidine kinase ChvG